MDYFHIKEMLEQVGIIKGAEHQKPMKTRASLSPGPVALWDLCIFESIFPRQSQRNLDNIFLKYEY